MTDEHGTIFWAELTVRDTKSACTFYRDLCGWSFETMPLQDGKGDYFICMKNGKPVCGILDATDMPYYDTLPPQWITYIEVDDVRVSVAKSVEFGGTLLRDCLKIPNVGTTATVIDPAGAAVALMTRVRS